ncbi:MAG: 3-phosphoshikimate 1-carboxyvinyltransferase [Candidatus Tantalella remota]|nr:3-phosphoshikimate 1-carboxyvinyltransferase [Candidatus Tantalella remota]
MDWKIKKAEKGLTGEIMVPPDKSISHRAVMFGSLSGGNCRVNNFLFGEDCLRTVDAFRAMGVKITQTDGGLTVEGKGLRGLTSPKGDLYLGNSGTTMRIISGVLAGQTFSTVLTGDESLSSRPMGRVIEPLSIMGADIEDDGGDGRAPLRINGRNSPLRGTRHVLSVASAQVKSCVLAAGMYVDGETSVTEPFQSRDHTERMLEYLSADIERDGLTTRIKGFKELEAKDMEVPGDISSAAFFMVGALLVKGSRLVLRNVGINPTRSGIVDVLKRMGASIEILDVTEGLEPVADVEVRYSDLKGTVVRPEEVPLLIDEIPVIAVAAAFAEGETVFSGVGELKVKETDRIKSMSDNLRLMGIQVEESGDSMVVHGDPGAARAVAFDSYGDHRVAMSMAIAALAAEGESCIADTACADTSYPGFMDDVEKLTG